MSRSKSDYSQYIGQTFGRLSVISLYRREKDNRECFHCKCSCGNLKECLCKCLLSGHTTSCGCAQKESQSINRSKGLKKMNEAVNKYLALHPEIRQENGRKTGKENLKKAHEYLDLHPEIRQENGRNNIKKANEYHALHPEIRREQNIQNKYKFQLFWETRLLDIENMLGIDIPIEAEFLLEDHYFDIKIGNLLIECNGIYWHRHCTQKENEEGIVFRESTYHCSLREIAIRNGYSLVQVWESPSLHNFYEQLIVDHLLGLADYHNYMKGNLLDNDYGFNVLGSFIDPVVEKFDRLTLESTDDCCESNRLTYIYRSGYTLV